MCAPVVPATVASGHFEIVTKALYELESPDVLVSDAWGKAVDTGRWPDEIRPYTKNRRVVLRHLMSAPS